LPKRSHTLVFGWGGKQTKLRPTTIVEGCLGNNEGRCLNVGDVQYMVFQEGDPPPTEGATEYVGKAKGIKQVLKERGLYTPEMRGELDNKEINRRIRLNIPLLDPALNMHLVLANCPDFKNEICALEEMLISRGHIMIKSPKCHPEVAGCGIEFTWGMGKKYYRANDPYDNKKSDLKQRIKNALDPIKVLHIKRIWKYSRRTRAYRSAYYDIYNKKLIDNNQTIVSYEKIQSMMKTYKTHRNILDIEQRFLNEN